MRTVTRMICVVIGAGLLLALPGQEARVHGQQEPQRGGGGGRGAGGGGRGQMEIWSPMPIKANQFVPPNKALTRIADLLAKHKSQPNWTEVVVHDHLFHGEYISMAAGAKTPRRFHQDHRVWWVVQDGQIRFTIGQTPA